MPESQVATAPGTQNLPPSDELLRRSPPFGLTIIHSPDAGMIHRRIPIDGTVVLGRIALSGGHFAIADPRISREHAAVLGTEANGFRVKDLGSRNGTFVEGQRVADAALAAGGLLRVGDTL